MTGAMRMEIKLYRNRINYLKYRKYFLQINSDSPAADAQIKEIDTDVLFYQTKIMRIYHQCGFMPLDTFML